MGKRYYSKKVEKYNIKWDSQTELDYWDHLHICKEKLGILSIERQVPFLIFKGFRVNNGKKLRDTVYKADFVITYKNGTKEIIDVKGCKETIEDLFKLKFKMCKKEYPEYIYKIIIKDKGEWKNIG
jgi:hypothetical protein